MMPGKSHAVFWLLWHAFATAALFSVLGLRFGIPPWKYNAQLAVAGVLVAAGYVLGATFLHLRNWRQTRVSLIDVVVAWLAGYSPIFLYIVVTGIQFSRLVLLVAAFAGLLLLAGGFALSFAPRLRLAVLVAVSVTIALLPVFSGGVLQAPSTRSQGVFQITSALYSVEAIRYRNFIPPTASHHTGGGIAALPRGGYLIATSDGNLLTVQWTGGSSTLEVTPLPLRLPLNRTEFVNASGPGGFVNYFRAFDVILRPVDGQFQILVSHHRWNVAEQCFTVQVSALDWDGTTPLAGLRDTTWRTLYNSEPCLELITSQPAWPFRGMEGGGRMAMLDANRLLLTVGDQGFNSVDFQVNHVQDPATSYGKTIIVDLRTGEWQPYTIGHRNPQGLWIDTTGAVWLTEHGPQGGDELNLLQDGEHYGWPFVTYGTDYGRQTWPLSGMQGRHEGYVKPVYSWLPSIGASNLLRVRGDLFGAWRGDLVIGSLVAEALWRIRVDGDQVRLVERVDLGERVRDLIEDPSGRLIILTDSYSLLVLAPTTHVYAQCATCHGPLDGSAPRLGPSLNGVVGRSVATVPGYQYSDALESLGGEWSEERLHLFLQDPQEFAPGTTMIMHGIGDEGTRNAIIEYLRTAGEI